MKESGSIESTIKLIREDTVSKNVSQISSIEDYMSDVPMYESSQSSDEIENDLNKTEEELPKKKIQFKEWIFCREYQNSDDAKSSIQTEKLWSQCKRQDIVNGTKVYYRCNLVKLRGPQCASSLYLLFKADCNIVLEFRTSSAHTHDDIVDRRSVEKKKALIREVERLIDLGVRPMNIMHDLSKMDDIQLPTKNQLTTIIAAIRRRKFGPATISMGALLQWLKENSKVPVDMHAAFVLSYEVNMEAKDPYFRFFDHNQAPPQSSWLEKF